MNQKMRSEIELLWEGWSNALPYKERIVFINNPDFFKAFTEGHIAALEGTPGEVVLKLTEEEFYHLYNTTIKKYCGPHSLEHATLARKFFDIDERLEKKKSE